MDNKRSDRPINLNVDNLLSESDRFVVRSQDSNFVLSKLQELYLSGRLNEAQKIFNTTLEGQSPLNESADFFCLGSKIAFALHESDNRAFDYLTQAKLCDPEHETAKKLNQLWEIVSLMKDGLYDKGHHTLLSYREKNVRCELGHYFHGYYYYWRNNALELAEEAFNDCTNIAPNFLPAWMHLSLIHGRNADSEKRALALEKCLQLGGAAQLKDQLI